ncbi:hypothetical protein PV10_05323 [Exophiala mesophila]|uniref:Copper acquisition factor BIM1-like domain-containing protein n=1 Tax=Exophiala mesophila TaxID=212818 RepID=A0A0D1WNR7_EXOME|nr:uncharacterized protein PV10_05323 [Exophiala mesophila]KIV90695.1 hypothetical protein PV10_05323 [Exophiala mesophila]
MRSRLILGLLSLPLIVSAHFHMLYPSPRSDEDDSEATFPCGGFAISKNRTQLSTVAFPLALEMGHDRTVIQVLLAVGNDPGDNFNIVLEPTFQQQGEGSFCLPTVHLPASLNLTAGTNGTIQVVTDGEGGGGLYVCADVTFDSVPSTTTLPSVCTNGTGVTAFPLDNPINANESTADGQSQDSSSASPSSSASQSASSTSTQTGAVGSSTNHAAMNSVGWGLFGAAILGGVALI